MEELLPSLLQILEDVMGLVVARVFLFTISAAVFLGAVYYTLLFLERIWRIVAKWTRPLWTHIPDIWTPIPTKLRNLLRIVRGPLLSRDLFLAVYLGFTVWLYGTLVTAAGEERWALPGASILTAVFMLLFIRPLRRLIDRRFASRSSYAELLNTSPAGATAYTGTRVTIWDCKVSWSPTDQHTQVFSHPYQAKIEVLVGVETTLLPFEIGIVHLELKDQRLSTLQQLSHLGISSSVPISFVAHFEVPPELSRGIETARLWITAPDGPAHSEEFEVDFTQPLDVDTGGSPSQ